jgi:hypothetical protein
MTKTLGSPNNQNPGFFQATPKCSTSPKKPGFSERFHPGLSKQPKPWLLQSNLKMLTVSQEARVFSTGFSAQLMTKKNKPCQ